MYRPSDFRSQQALIILLTISPVISCLMVYFGFAEMWRIVVFGISTILFGMICLLLFGEFSKLIYESRFGKAEHKVVTALFSSLSSDDVDPSIQRYMFEHATRVLREDPKMYAGSFIGVADRVLLAFSKYVSDLIKEEHASYKPGPLPEHYREVADKLEQLIRLKEVIISSRGDVPKSEFDTGREGDTSSSPRPDAGPIMTRG